MSKRREMEDTTQQKIFKWLRNISNGILGHEVEAVATKGVRLVKLHKGFLLCDFVIHNSVSDESGNWHVGAMATLIDVIGSLTAFSFTANDNVTVDFSTSYYSKPKLQEEVEVEGKVVGKMERMTSVRVEVRKKQSGELVALGNMWMGAANSNASHRPSSKL